MTEEIPIEEFCRGFSAVTNFGIQYLRQLVGDLFIFGIHELGDEDLRKEPREIIELEANSLLSRSEHSRREPGEIRHC